MNKIRLIIWREFITRVRKPSFLIMTILGPVLIAGGILLTAYLGMQDDNDERVLVIDPAHVIANKLKNEDNVTFFVDNNVWADSAFKESPYSVMVQFNDDVLNEPVANIYYKELPSSMVQRTITNELEKSIELAKLREGNIDEEAYRRVRKQLKVKLFDIEQTGEESFEQERAMVGFFFGYFMFIFIFMYGVQVMRGVMEEKQSRVVEVLISSVKPFQLMMGKIIGIALVGFLQFVLWIVITTTVATVGIATLAHDKFDPATLAQNGVTAEMGQQIVAEGGANMIQESSILSLIEQIDLPYVLAVFLFYFICGYLLYSSLLAAIGSAVDNEADTQQFMLPITIPMVIAILIAQMGVHNPGSAAVLWCSFIPFTSPIVIMVRVAMGNAPLWQLLLSMAILVATFIGTTWLAGRIYRTGILMYGKKTSWKELGKWLTYKG